MLCVINADAAGLKILKAKYRPGFSPGLFSIKKTTCRATFPATDLKKVYDGEKEKIKNPLKRDREKRRRKENADDLSFAKGKVPPLCRRAWESILGGKAMIEIYVRLKSGKERRNKADCVGAAQNGGGPPGKIVASAYDGIAKTAGTFGFWQEKRDFRSEAPFVVLLFSALRARRKGGPC